LYTSCKAWLQLLVRKQKPLRKLHVSTNAIQGVAKLTCVAVLAVHAAAAISAVLVVITAVAVVVVIVVAAAGADRPSQTRCSGVQPPGAVL
jgi:hypothetical protein